MAFSRQEYWSWLPFSTPGGPPDSGMKPKSLAYPALAGGSLLLAPPGKPPKKLCEPEGFVCERTDFD